MGLEIVLIVGGGFALGSAVALSGLGEMMAQWFSRVVGGLPLWLILFFSVTFFLVLTEFTTNTATALTFFPVLISIACAVGVDPRQLMAPCALATSGAFMFPIATPPNLIVFSTGRVGLGTMALRGFFLNVLTSLLLVLGGLFFVPRVLQKAEDNGWVDRGCASMMSNDR